MTALTACSENQNPSEPGPEPPVEVTARSSPLFFGFATPTREQDMQLLNKQQLRHLSEKRSIHAAEQTCKGIVN
jgi:hypothetical protein